MDNQLLDLQYLIDAISSLPGIGKKSARRIANFLISSSDEYIMKFIKRIENAKNNIVLCTHCNNLTNFQQSLCYICSNKQRDKSKLCIVSSVEDLNIIEESNKYNGLYYVLWGELNIKKTIDISELNTNKLFKQFENSDLKEVIIATNLTINGRFTAASIYEKGKKINSKLIFSQLGFGLPINASIDYADVETIGYSISNRTKIDK